MCPEKPEKPSKKSETHGTTFDATDTTCSAVKCFFFGRCFLLLHLQDAFSRCLLIGRWHTNIIKSLWCWSFFFRSHRLHFNWVHFRFDPLHLVLKYAPKTNHHFFSAVRAVFRSCSRAYCRVNFDRHSTLSRRSVEQKQRSLDSDNTNIPEIGSEWRWATRNNPGIWENKRQQQQ